MFQFGRFPCHISGMTALEHRRVSPFGYLRLSRSYTPHRSFSQYNTSFIGTRCLGIHCVPLIAFRTIVRSLRLSWHATIGITFALIIQLVICTRRASRTASASLRSPPQECKTQIANYFDESRACACLNMSDEKGEESPNARYLNDAFRKNGVK